MAITVNTAAPVTDMTELDQVATELGLSASEKTTHTNLINRLIKVNSDLIRSYTGRVFAQETVTETFFTFGHERLIVSRTPIVSIDTIELDGNTVDSDNYEIEDAGAGFIWNETGWDRTNVLHGPYTPTPKRVGKFDWSVKYTAGYKMPGEASRNFPYDLEEACIKLVKQDFFERAQNPNISSEEIGDARIDYGVGRYERREKLDIVSDVLDKYVRLDF